MKTIEEIYGGYTKKRISYVEYKQSKERSKVVVFWPQPSWVVATLTNLGRKIRASI